MFLDFYVAALCNLDFMICSSYTKQVWPSMAYCILLNTFDPRKAKEVYSLYTNYECCYSVMKCCYSMSVLLLCYEEKLQNLPLKKRSS